MCCALRSSENKGNRRVLLFLETESRPRAKGASASIAGFSQSHPEQQIQSKGQGTGMSWNGSSRELGHPQLMEISSLWLSPKNFALQRTLSIQTCPLSFLHSSVNAPDRNHEGNSCQKSQTHPKPGWEITAETHWGYSCSTKKRLGGVTHCGTCRKSGGDTHSCLKTRIEKTLKIFLIRDPKERKGESPGFQHAEWSMDISSGTVRFWKSGRSQGTCFWCQQQGTRQGISLTCRIISSLVGTHIISHLGDFLAFMLYLHSIKREQIMEHHPSAQHKYILRIHYMPPNSHLHHKEVHFQRSKIN